MRLTAAAGALQADPAGFAMNQVVVAMEATERLVDPSLCCTEALEPGPADDVPITMTRS